MRLRHVVTGVVVNVRDDKTLGSDWVAVEGEVPASAEPAEFDPTLHKVDDVIAYLVEADDDERARVIEAEAAGKARKGITEWAPASAEPTV